MATSIQMLLVIFALLALLGVVLEEVIHINKAKTTLFFGSLSWLVMFMSAGGHIQQDARRLDIDCVQAQRVLVDDPVDPAIGAQIHPWIFWRHRRVRGREAARILIERQLQGLDALVARGVLVKVNSVLIPGVNDRHLPEVSRLAKAKGAFLHNVMPLIAAPEHGTFYGLMGQRGPSAAELAAVQERCAGDMKLMRHCQQCRADAIGLLGEDRSAEFSLADIESLTIDPVAAQHRRAATRAAIEARRAAQRPTGVLVTLASRRAAPPVARPLRAALATSGGGLIDQHFGQAEAFAIYDVDDHGAHLRDTRVVVPYCHGPTECGEDAAVWPDTLRALADCDVVLCARIGYEPWRALEAAGVGLRLDQFSNPDNPAAHYASTGPEIWRDTAGQVTHFVSAMGTTGTIMGVSRYLKERDPRIVIVGVQPAAGSNIPGIRRWPPEYLPRIYEPERVDQILDVSQAEAEETTRQLAAREGIFAGISSGGAVAAALRLARELRGATVVVIVCDRGERYLSTGVFSA